MAVVCNSIFILLLTFQIIISSSVEVAGHESSTSSTCDWRARSNFYAIQAILENKMKDNDTLLYELAGIFSNKQRPLKQVIVHYSIQLPLNEEDCDTELHCDLQYDDEAINLGENCPPGYRCLETDFIWGRYPATAQDTVFRDLDVCPLVIGDYEQRAVTIYFTLNSPPSCNMSVVDNDTIETEEFPCGWQCSTLRNIYPSNGDPNEAIVLAVDRESPLDRALTGITAKLLQYSTEKVSLPSLEYDISDARGYAAKLNHVTYFNAAAEYGIFLSAYILLQAIIFMLIFRYKADIYTFIFDYITNSHVNFSLFWSSIVTFFIFCFYISFVFAVEGGICITLLQLYVMAISLAPGCFYPVVAIFFVKKEKGFFNTVVDKKRETCIKVPTLDRSVQVVVMWFIYTVPHVLVLIFFLTSVSFFHNSNGTTFLILYFASSSVILWIANAIVIYLVSPYFWGFRCNGKFLKEAAQRTVFAVCLGLSLNLMNFSVMPFVGDFYYDRRADGSTIFSLIPILVTLVGWYLSGELVEGFSAMSFGNKPANNTKEKGKKWSLKDIFTLKPWKNKANNKSDAVELYIIEENSNSNEIILEGLTDVPIGRGTEQLQNYPKFQCKIVNAVRFFPQQVAATNRTAVLQSSAAAQQDNKNNTITRGSMSYETTEV